MPDKSGDYAFFGQTIKLAPRHLSEWRRLFHTIADVEAELSTLDSWWQTQSEAKRENWFLATKGMLNKKHQTNLAARKAEARLAVEPAPAAAVAAAMGPLRERLAGKRVCLVICGANIDGETYGALLERGRTALAAKIP